MQVGDPRMAEMEEQEKKKFHNFFQLWGALTDTMEINVSHFEDNINDGVIAWNLTPDTIKGCKSLYSEKKESKKFVKTLPI